MSQYLSLGRETFVLLYNLYIVLKEDNVLSMTANLPYGPPVNTDIIIRLFSDFLFL